MYLLAYLLHDVDFNGFKCIVLGVLFVSMITLLCNYYCVSINIIYQDRKHVKLEKEKTWEDGLL